MDVILAFPQIVLVLLFVSMLGPQALADRRCSSRFAWVPQVARVARGVTADVVHREYVRGGRGDRPAAAPDPRCARSCPTSTTPLLVEYGLRLTWSIAVIAAVSFLGFGIQPPNADWGLMINENRDGASRSSPGRSSRRPRASRSSRSGRTSSPRASRGRSPASAAGTARERSRSQGLRVELARGGSEIVDEIAFDARARRGRRARRRVGLGQDHGRGRAARPRAARARGSRAARCASAASTARRSAPRGAARARGQARRLRAAGSRRRPSTRRSRIGAQLEEVIDGARRSAADRERIARERSPRSRLPADPRAPAPLPAPALRRPAAADLPRDGLPAPARR